MIMAEKSYRILLVDDDQQILNAYLDVLSRAEDVGIRELRGLAEILFDGEESADNKQYKPTTQLRIDAALQGAEAVHLATKAIRDEDPYLVAIVDMRIPPGINGFETAQKLVELDPDVEICFITAYSDTSLGEITESLGNGRFLLLRKPIDRQELITMVSFLGAHGARCHESHSATKAQ